MINLFGGLEMSEVEAASNETLTVSGPATVTLLAGKAEVLGAPLTPERKITVRRWRLLPIYCLEASRFRVELGSGGELSKHPRSTVPERWKAAAGEILEKAEKEGLLTAVLGGVDVGKTTFTVYLSNRALASGLTVSVVDGDVGQSDLGPPCTVGSSQLSHPVFDLFFVKPERLVFVGSTTPSRVEENLVKGLRELCSFERRRSKLVVMNTDGWISGGDAEGFKVRLVEAVEADVVVGLQSSQELESILSRLEGKVEVVRLPAAPLVRPRSRSERRGLRWQAYNKYLMGASILNLKVSRVKVSGKPTPGAIVGLYASKPERRLLGIGVILAWQRQRGALKILTAVKGLVGEVVVGEVLPDFCIRRGEPPSREPSPRVKAGEPQL
ncbi:hypothetical protein DRO53_00190 [Candidatus Bathyarchaeota archaeon]|nr:MAG: hypothetical protein DRO53_00190 [Candidatus Bathyarchaeota archaeon]